jgi:hypothetical protein
MTVRIIDCSNYQNGVNWQAVLASGRAGGICKATEGTGFVDATFVRNWQTLGSLDARRGAYHFARSGDPIAQAMRFLSIVGPVKADDILVLDIEDNTMGGDLSGWALTFLATVEAHAGLTPWLYSYAPYIHAHLQGSGLARYPLWLAAYQSTPPPAPAPWTRWTLWQHTDRAAVPGVPGVCDESIGELTAATPPITPGVAMAHLPNPVAAAHRPGAPPEQFAVIGRDGSMWCFNGAPYCDAYNAHPELGGSDVRAAVGFAWDDDGWGYVQYFDDGAHYHWRAPGH